MNMKLLVAAFTFALGGVISPAADAGNPRVKACVQAYNYKNTGIRYPKSVRRTACQWQLRGRNVQPKDITR